MSRLTRVRGIRLSSCPRVDGREPRQTLGIVQGNTVQARFVGRDIMAQLKALVGGEISAYTELLAEARDLATQRMVEQAESLGANAVVNIRYETSSVMQNAAEVLCYGTAVKVEEETQ